MGIVTIVVMAIRVLVVFVPVFFLLLACAKVEYLLWEDIWIGLPVVYRNKMSMKLSSELEGEGGISERPLRLVSKDLSDLLGMLYDTVSASSMHRNLLSFHINSHDTSPSSKAAFINANSYKMNVRMLK